MFKRKFSQFRRMLLLTAVTALCSFQAKAQWGNFGPDIINTNPGNVGINLTPPATPLEKLHLNGAFYMDSNAAPATTTYRLYNTSGNLYWSGINITGNLLPAGSTGMTLYHDGSTWQASTAFYNNGLNIGIGTASPSAKLHVTNGSILFSGTTGSTPTSGAGTRFMWVPSKSSLRAGYAVGSNWDNSNIGSYSAALGYGTKASGAQSFAWGYNNIASGVNATAIGDSTDATDSNATALGYYTTASGENSIAAGNYTKASGSNSFSLGRRTTASGENSVASGYYATASGLGSFAHGNRSVANGLFSFAFGSNVTNGSNPGCFIAGDTRSHLING